MAVYKKKKNDGITQQIWQCFWITGCCLGLGEGEGKNGGAGKCPVDVG